MSHTVTLKLQFRDPKCLALACTALSLAFQQGRQTLRLFAGQSVEADFSLQLPGWRFPVGIDIRTGQVSFDHYNGQWGQIQELHRFSQEYALQVAQQEPSVQELLFKGWTASRVAQPDGIIQLVLEGT